MQCIYAQRCNQLYKIKSTQEIGTQPAIPPWYTLFLKCRSNTSPVSMATINILSLYLQISYNTNAYSYVTNTLPFFH